MNPMKSYSVRRTGTSGQAFSQAVVLTDFSFPWESGAAPLTEFRALHDEQSLYFRFDCSDQDLVLADGKTARERVEGSDRVELFVAPSRALDPYYCLEIDPRAEVHDYRCRLYRQFDWDWRFPGLSATARVEGNRYWVEARLPLDTLHALDVLKPGAREFYAGVYRAELSHRPDGSVHFGWLPWVDPRTEKPDFHVPESFGRFELL
ncbi:MAG TPA: carbohydrate-binding family 9-like protein [Polyangiaceae bacterium]|nr:carbohydrate-binding family 9-like protein [Polyangiaceae bacterium]